MRHEGAYPVGVALAHGAFIIAERVRGEAGSGQFRAVDRGDATRRRVLVTVTGPQARSHVALAQELELPFVGVAPLRYVGSLDARGPGGAPFDGMVEEEPRGTPCSKLALPLAPPQVSCLVRQLAAVLRVLHAERQGVGGLAPELVYVDRDRTGELALTGLAPRAPRFALSARRTGQALGAMFACCYLAPEGWAHDRDLAAADVFSLAAMAAHWITGQHPFEGEGFARQALAISADRRRPWSGPQDLEPILDRALEPDPRRRAGLDDLVHGLTR